MITLETHWTLGVLIGYPIAGLILLAAIIATVLMFRFDEEMMGWFGIVAIVIVSVAVAAASYPWKPEYHQFRTVQGPVQEVGKRLIAEDKSMSERYVLKINGQAYGVDDTRASLVKVGDTVTISCRRDWQYASTSGYVCRWVG
jgi:membrane protein implicated in regulation of membrane protease activity